MNRLEESALKVKRVRTLLDKTGANGIVIRKQPNFSWITSGGRPFIGLASEAACAAILVTKDGVYAAGNNIEIPRLMKEELPQGFAEAVACPWQEDGEIDLGLARRFGTLISDTEQNDWFREERIVLMESEIIRYAQLGSAAAAVLESVCNALKPGQTELEAAGLIAQGLWAAGIEPITVLVAADDRSNTVRHYVPTFKKIQTGVICSICARQGGLVASATRTVAFAKDFASNYGKLLKVEEAAFNANRDGIALGDVLRRIMDAYTANGLAAEWNNHHQGGLTGYLAREIRVGPGCPAQARIGEAFAWNPSAPGAKCEDTVLLEKDGIRVLTARGPSWPAVTVGGLSRPDILRK